MAIVVDKAGRGELDNSYDSPNRSGAGSPQSTVTPEYSGELYQDSTTGDIHQAQSLKIDSWAPYVRGDGHR